MSEPSNEERPNDSARAADLAARIRHGVQASRLAARVDRVTVIVLGLIAVGVLLRT